MGSGVCRVCGVVLTKENMYKSQTDRLCKPHLREYKKKKYNENIERYHANRKRYESVHDKTPERKKQLNETSKRMLLKYPEKWSARAKARYAVKTGAIEKMPCSKCGEEKVEAHHDDYAKPLSVMWLCKKHHVERHKELSKAL